MLKWFIYVLAIITACLSIVLFVLDQMDTDRAMQQEQERNSSRPVKVDSQTKNNIILGLLMLSSTAPASFHYCSPRLFFIALLVILSALTLICRSLLATVFRAQYLMTVILTAICGCLYFYLVGFKAKDPYDSSWRTFVQPNNRDLVSGAGSSSAAEDNVQVIVVRKPKKKTTTRAKSRSKKSDKTNKS